MKRVGILVVAYNAASTLAAVLDRIPADFRSRVNEVLVFDDHSDDPTYLVALGYKELAPDLPLTVIRHARNLGYGGNQKAGYRWAVDHGLDIIVLLHGDGQYAPECLPDIVAPLERGECDAVFGSRMMERGGARRGGMPAYKFVGNRILTKIENTIVGTELSEWHSGYRAYSVAALRNIPFENNSDGFDFDTEIIIQLHSAGKRIVEIPIPTYYGDEISHVNGLKYAKDVISDAARYRLHKLGLGSGELSNGDPPYGLKKDQNTSHQRILTWLSGRSQSRILDLGCSDGALGDQLRGLGHEVTGVDVEDSKPVRDRVDTFITADLEDGIPPEVGSGYDIVLAADVLEHVRQPQRILADAHRCLRPGGSLIVSIPNFAHWYPRTRVAMGFFDYDQRGILDRGHVRFFTRRSFERLARAQGFAVRRREALGSPVELLDRASTNQRIDGRSVNVLQWIDGVGLAVRPTLFAYQFLFELEPEDLEEVAAVPAGAHETAPR